jgi:hypothetical protein
LEGCGGGVLQESCSARHLATYGCMGMCIICRFRSI